MQTPHYCLYKENFFGKLFCSRAGGVLFLPKNEAALYWEGLFILREDIWPHDVKDSWFH